MEVTCENFATALPLVADALSGCCFYAFDCEFTGLHVADGQRSYYDELQDRYEAMVTSSEAFLINQFGLSAFSWDEAGGCYVARTFNFYLFPRPFEGYDRRFLCQASSLAFLAGQGFDFNKFISQGITFMTLQQRDALLARVDAQATADADDAIIEIRQPADVEFVTKLREAVSSWLADPTAGKRLDLPAVNGYLRKIQYQQLRQDQFGAPDPPGFHVERTSVEGRRTYLSLIRASKEEAEQLSEEQRQARIDAVNAAAGFSAVWELMRSCGKPGVGHNLTLDLSYSLASFVAELPPTWQEYKELVRSWLPGGLFDTKYLAENLVPRRGSAPPTRPAPTAATPTAAATVAAGNGVSGDAASTPIAITPAAAAAVAASTPAAAAVAAASGAAATAAAAAAAAASSAAAAASTYSSGLGDLFTALELREGDGAALLLRWAEAGAAATAAAKPRAAAASEEEQIEQQQQGGSTQGGVAAMPEYRPPVVRHAPGFERYVGASVDRYSHEAGYDAFMTGAVFAHLSSLYSHRAACEAAAGGGSAGQQQEEKEAAEAGFDGSDRLAAVRGLMGKLRVARSDYPCLNLFSDDPIPDRSRLLVLPDSRQVAARGEVGRLAEAAGLGNARPSFPSSSARVGAVAAASNGTRHMLLELPLSYEGTAQEAADALTKEKEGLKVLTYAQWKEQRSEAASPATGTTPATKRRRMAS